MLLTPWGILQTTKNTKNIQKSEKELLKPVNLFSRIYLKH